MGNVLTHSRMRDFVVISSDFELKHSPAVVMRGAQLCMAKERWQGSGDARRISLRYWKKSRESTRREGAECG